MAKDKEPINLACHICGQDFQVIQGTKMDAKDGITVRCDNPGCLPHESVEGHGSTVKEAIQIAFEKYKKPND